MCLVALALEESRRFPLVIAANRDEFFERPTARLGWWSPENGGSEILGGRDLRSGGTWLGLNNDGRLALVTNVRNPQRNDPDAPSRGRIVPMWLRGDMPLDKFWMRVGLEGYNGFNLIAADLSRGECFWASNHADFPRRLDKGIYGLSNAFLDTPWPKVERLKQILKASLKSTLQVETLVERLFVALTDTTVMPDEFLPHTGVPQDWERWLSAAFIRTPDHRYGTRSSTLVVTERVRSKLITHVIERTYSNAKGPSYALIRRSTLKGWPPLRMETVLPELAPAAAAPKPRAAAARRLHK